MACEIKPYTLPEPAKFPEWQHLYEATRTLADGRTVKVKAGLHYMRGNARPYFSVTGDIYTARGAWDNGGQVSSETLEAFPELTRVQALHLSWSNGEPFHIDNGWYFISGYYGGLGEPYHGGNSKQQIRDAAGKFIDWREPTPDESLEMAARILRVKVNALKRTAARWQADGDGSRADIKARFLSWVDAQRARWQLEAQDGIDTLESLRGNA
jgi:hypothetical protein